MTLPHASENDTLNTPTPHIPVIQVNWFVNTVSDVCGDNKQTGVTVNIIPQQADTPPLVSVLEVCILQQQYLDHF